VKGRRGSRSGADGEGADGVGADGAGQSEWADGRGQSGDAAQDYRGIEGSHKAVGDGRR
jgi:hypothetical protein